MLIFKLFFIFIIFVLIIFGGLSALIANIGDNNIAISEPPLSVDKIESKKPIFLDVAIDENQNIHLVWLSKEKGLAYQNSNDWGKTWSQSTILFNDTTQGSLAFPRILILGEAINIFWKCNGFNQLVSMDRGLSWSNVSKVPLEYFGGNFQLFSKDTTLFLIGGNNERIFFTKSEDNGLNWESSISIAQNTTNRTFYKKNSIAINNETIHLVCGPRFPSVGKDIPADPGIPYWRGEDMGKNWSDFINIDVSKEGEDYLNNYGLSNPMLASIDGILLIAFEQSGLGFVTSNNNGATWSPRIMLTKIPAKGVLLCAKENKELFVFWVNNKHKKQDWWSYIPLHQIVTWDASSSWHNNDLYFAIIQDGNVAKKVRLTLPMSYTCRYYNSKAASQIGESVVVFWCGKRKVGRSRGDSKLPYEIFYRILK